MSISTVTVISNPETLHTYHLRMDLLHNLQRAEVEVDQEVGLGLEVGLGPCVVAALEAGKVPGAVEQDLGHLEQLFLP
jgi:hypothetical protein